MLPNVTHARLRRLRDHADMGGDHAPTVGKPHPGLHLAADTAGGAVAMKQRRGQIGRAHV